MPLARAVTRRIRAGKESKPKTQRQIANLRKLYAQISKGKGGMQRVSMLKSPDQIVAAARAAPPWKGQASSSAQAPSYATPAPAYTAPAQAYNSVAPAYTNRPAVGPATSFYNNRPRAAAASAAQAPNPTDSRVPPHLRRGYRTMLGGGLWNLFSTFSNYELNLIANQPQREPQVRATAAKVVSSRAARQAAPAPVARPYPAPVARPYPAPYARPYRAPYAPGPVPTLAVLAQPAPAPTFAPSTYTPTAKAINQGRYARGGGRNFGEDEDFGTELPAGYEATPTLWTSVTSHPFAAIAAGAAIFAGGVVLSEQVKDTFEETWDGYRHGHSRY